MPNSLILDLLQISVPFCRYSPIHSSDSFCFHRVSEVMKGKSSRYPFFGKYFLPHSHYFQLNSVFCLPGCYLCFHFYGNELRNRTAIKYQGKSFFECFMGKMKIDRNYEQEKIIIGVGSTYYCFSTR